MKKINFAIIGAGMVGEVHLKELLSDKRVAVTALCDRDKDLLISKASKYQIPQIFTNHKKLFNVETIDAVVIATPPSSHFDILKDAILANKKIIIEKPVVTKENELKNLIALMKKKNPGFIIDCSARHSRLQPKFYAIKNIIETGIIGNVYHIHHRHLMRNIFIEYNKNAFWSLEKAKSGGGPFIDWGVYDLSFHLGLLGDVHQIKSIDSNLIYNLRSKFKTDVEQHSFALMEFDNDLTYFYERGSGVHIDKPNETIIYGTKGTLSFGYYSWDSNTVEVNYEDKNGKLKKTIKTINMSKHTNDNKEFVKYYIDLIVGKRKVILSFEKSLEYLSVLLKAVK